MMEHYSNNKWLSKFEGLGKRLVSFKASMMQVLKYIELRFSAMDIGLASIVK